MGYLFKWVQPLASVAQLAPGAWEIAIAMNGVGETDTRHSGKTRSIVGGVQGDVLIMRELLIFQLPGADHSPNQRRILEYPDGPAANKMHSGAFWRGPVDGGNPIEGSMVSHGFQKCLGDARVWTTPSSPVNLRSGKAS